MVPLTIPMTWSIGSPSSDSRRGRTSGMPPPTAASNSTSTPDASAVANTSPPWLASSSLLAVMTGLPALSASRMNWRAGSMPPITSMTTSMSGSLTTDAASLVKRSRGRSTPRSFEALRTATRVISMLQARARLDAVGLLTDQLDEGRADRAASEQTDPHR